MGGGGDFGSGTGSKFNCAARVGSGRVGSDDLGYGPGSGFSFEPVQTSSENARFVAAEVNRRSRPFSAISLQWLLKLPLILDLCTVPVIMSTKK